LEPLVNPIQVAGCDDLYPILDQVLREWKVTFCQPENQPSPKIEIRHTNKGYCRVSPWTQKPRIFADPVDTVCDLIVDLVNAYVADREGLLCLHCAAVDFGQGLIVFPNTYRDGKSTLTIRLAVTGARIYSDDVLPISQNPPAGIALGIQPRLRIPLPANATPAYRKFVADQAGPGNHRYQYVAMDEFQQAPLGTIAPIQAIVVLNRVEGQPPELVAADKGKMLKDVILRNFARQNPALEILDALYAIVEQAECYTLKYSDLEDATGLLEQAFGSKGWNHLHADKQLKTKG
jgi:hypothetical protein